MRTYILRRLLQIVPTMFAVSLLVFILIHASGDPMAIYSGDPNITAEEKALVAAKYGFDKPLYIQYLVWLGNVFRGNWGISFVTARPVSEMIRERLPNSLILMGTAFVASLLIGIPLGIYSAVRQYSTLDYITTGMAMIGFATPIFWLGLTAIIVFSVFFQQWGLPSLPAGGMYTLAEGRTFASVLKHLILPASVIAFVDAAPYIRYTRASMLEVLKQDYVRTARATGLSERVVIYRHALRNALGPVVTVMFMRIPNIFGGAMITEQVFAWPGMGRLFWEHAERVDYPVLMGVLMLVAFAVMVCNLFADVMYALLDPRIRYS